MSGYGGRVLVLLVAALVPVTGLAAAWLLDVAGRERQRLEDAVTANAEAVVSRIDGEIARHIDVLRALAASPLIDTGEIDAFRQHLLQVKADQPLWRNVLLADRNQMQVLNLRLPDVLRQVSVPASHERVLSTGNPAVTPLSAGGVSGYRTVGVLVPVTRDGEPRYVLTAVLDLSALAQLLRTAVPEQWRAAVADQNQQIIVRTSDGDAAAGQPIAETAMEAILQGREGDIRHSTSAAGDDYVAMYVRSRVAGWTVHVGFPVAALSLLQTRPLQLAAGGAAISLGLALLLAYLLFRELRASRRQTLALAESQHLEALGRLTGGIAHDFNNLLMIVQGAAQGVQRRVSEPERIAPYIDGILTAVQRGAAITRQLLSYARNERQSPTTFDLAARAGDLSTLLAQSTRGNVEATLSIPSGTWPIYADPNALEVALINLAVNARDAMPDGGHLTVSATNVTLRPGDDADTGLSGDYVAITVADNGKGIAAEHLSRVFQPFFTTKHPGKGTGLGLSQVFGFAKQSGGTVTVSSVVGLGTAFRLYLPRSREAASSESSGGVTAASADFRRVLLVEDNTEVARAVEMMLDTAGIGYVSAASGDEALELLRGDRAVDLVLSDIVLGSGMSGLELETRIREIRPGLPVVLMTGYSEALAAGTVGGRHVLAKPFRQEELMAALNAARAGRRKVA